MCSCPHGENETTMRPAWFALPCLPCLPLLCLLPHPLPVVFVMPPQGPNDHGPRTTCVVAAPNCCQPLRTASRVSILILAHFSPCKWMGDFQRFIFFSLKNKPPFYPKVYLFVSPFNLGALFSNNQCNKINICSSSKVEGWIYCDLLKVILKKYLKHVSLGALFFK